MACSSSKTIKTDLEGGSGASGNTASDEKLKEEAKKAVQDAEAATEGSKNFEASEEEQQAALEKASEEAGKAAEGGQRLGCGSTNGSKTVCRPPWLIALDC